MTHEHQPEQPQAGETPALTPLPETSRSAEGGEFHPTPNPEAEQPDSREAVPFPKVFWPRPTPNLRR